MLQVACNATCSHSVCSFSAVLHLFTKSSFLFLSHLNHLWDFFMQYLCVSFIHTASFWSQGNFFSQLWISHLHCFFLCLWFSPSFFCLFFLSLILSLSQLCPKPGYLFCTPWTFSFTSITIFYSFIFVM